MPVTVWRCFAWLGIVLTAISILGDVGLRPAAGSYGLVTTSDGTAQIVERVEPHSAAADAGLARGDRLVLARDDFIYRVRFAPLAAPGDVLPLAVTRAGRTRAIELAARSLPNTFGGLAAAYEFIRLVLIVLGALIVARGSRLPPARALATFYIAFAFGFLGRPPWYGEALRAAAALLRPAAVFYAFACLARFAAIFPEPSARGMRKHVPRVATLLACCNFGLVALGSVVPFVFGSSSLDAAGYDRWSPFAVVALFGAQLVCIALAFVIGAREASAVDKGRLRWLAFSFAIGFAGFFPAVALEIARVPQSAWFLLPLTLLAIPIGSTYAILRQRVIDVDFIVNRAIVFAILSALVVAAFSLLEVVLAKVLVSAGHVESSVLEALLAICVALTLGRLHGRIDRLVDATLFREHHAAELALQRLTRETALMTDPDALGTRVVTAVERHARLQFAAIFIGDAEGTYRLRWNAGAPVAERTAVDENDPAIVRLKTFGEPVDFAELAADGAPSALPGNTAFPLLVRGELLGLLACGAPHASEALAPDERATLRALAAATGVALDTLRTSALRRAVARALSGDGGLDALREAHAVFGLLAPPRLRE